MQPERDPLPDEFASPEEAAELWDRHDTTDYLDCFSPVAVDAQLERRRFLLELDRDLAEALRAQAQAKGVGFHSLVTELLREKSRSAA